MGATIGCSDFHVKKGLSSPEPALEYPLRSQPAWGRLGASIGISLSAIHWVTVALYLKNSFLRSKCRVCGAFEVSPRPSTTLSSSMDVISNCDSLCFYRNFGAGVRKKSKVVMCEDKETERRSRTGPVGEWQGRERPKFPKLSLTLVTGRRRIVLISWVGENETVGWGWVARLRTWGEWKKLNRVIQRLRRKWPPSRAGAQQARCQGLREIQDFLQGFSRTHGERWLFCGFQRYTIKRVRIKVLAIYWIFSEMDFRSSQWHGTT